MDGVHGIFFSKHNPEALVNAFSLLLSNGRLSKFAQAIASSGRELAKNILALDCITGYARLLENVLSFPSDALLPGPVSLIQQGSWEWNLFQNEIDQDIHLSKMDGDFFNGKVSIVYAVEHELKGLNYSTSIFENGTEVPLQDELTQLDWDILREIEISEENEMFEMEEVWCNLPNLPFCVSVSSVCNSLSVYFRDTWFHKVISFCYRLKREWRKMLVYGMIYIVMLENLRN